MDQYMERTAGRVKRRRRTRGETLVETIVAFGVLTILLTMVTTVVRAGVALNNHAISRTAMLNKDSADIERGNALTVLPGENTLTLAYPDGTPGAEDIRIQLTVQQGEGGILQNFTTAAVAELGGEGE